MPAPLLLDSQGRTVDQTGKVMKEKKSVVATLKVCMCYFVARRSRSCRAGTPSPTLRIPMAARTRACIQVNRLAAGPVSNPYLAHLVKPGQQQATAGADGTGEEGGATAAPVVDPRIKVSSPPTYILDLPPFLSLSLSLSLYVRVCARGCVCVCGCVCVRVRSREYCSYLYLTPRGSTRGTHPSHLPPATSNNNR